MSDFDLSGRTDNQISQLASAGHAGARAHELAQFNKFVASEEAKQAATGGGSAGAPSTPLSAWVLPLLVFGLPVAALVLTVVGLAQGTTWLARESIIAPLFPAPGDSVLRYVVSSATLLVLIPGGLGAGGMWLHGTRLRPVARLVVLPAAVLLVPVLLFVTQTTASADLLRLGS